MSDVIAMASVLCVLTAAYVYSERGRTAANDRSQRFVLQDDNGRLTHYIQYMIKCVFALMHRHILLIIKIKTV